MCFSLSSLLVLALKITHIESLHYIKWANHVRQATVVRNVVCVIWCGIPYELNNNKQLIKVTKIFKKLEQAGLDQIAWIQTLKTSHFPFESFFSLSHHPRWSLEIQFRDSLVPATTTLTTATFNFSQEWVLPPLSSLNIHSTLALKRHVCQFFT